MEAATLNHRGSKRNRYATPTNQRPLQKIVEVFSFSLDNTKNKEKRGITLNS